MLNDTKKTVIVKINGGTACCRFGSNGSEKLDIFYDDEVNLLNNIYVGQVRDIVKNIEAAFVEYVDGTVGFLALKDIHTPYFLCTKNTTKVCEGDKIIVQVLKNPIKTKDAVLTTDFSLNGKYIILTYGHNNICFSNKIKDVTFKKDLLPDLETLVSEEFGFIVRTNAYEADKNLIIEEAKQLIEKYNELVSIAKCRPKHYLLQQAENSYTAVVRDSHLKDGDEIITDDLDVYNELCKVDTPASLRLYEDKLLPLYKLHSFEKLFDDIKSKKIWLKSGAYLIIEYTEAMTVIDVNTGKCERGKNSKKTFLNINLEAGREIARQLSLRNISGIIVIDFIDMEDHEDKEALLKAMKDFVKYDDIKTNIIDFTKLNLMEITRKKMKDRIFIRDNMFSKN